MKVGLGSRESAAMKSSYHNFKNQAVRLNLKLDTQSIFSELNFCTQAKLNLILVRDCRALDENNKLINII